MLRLNSTPRAIFVTVLVACSGDDGGSATATTGDTTTSATEASTSSGSTTETTTTGSTTDDVTTTGSTTDDVTTTGVTPQPCEQDECVYGHSIEGEGGLPGAICQNLLWTCAFPSPCPAVQIDPVTPKVADVDAATCAVQAMMAADRAVITLPGLGTDSGALFIVGDGTAMIQWNESAGDVVYSIRSGRLELQPMSYFEACLADPTPEALGACLIAGSSATYNGAWTPPWSTGECTFDAPEDCAIGR